MASSPPNSPALRHPSAPPTMARPDLPSVSGHQPTEVNRAEAIGRYRSGVLSSFPRPASPTTSRTSSLSSTTHRRPRAGTMPSHSAANSALSLVNAPPSARPEILRQLNLMAPATPSNPFSARPAAILGHLPPSATQPALHSSNSEINLRLSLEKTRARAGTVALPPSSASSYFGRGVFSANFVPRTSRMNEEVRSMRSDDSLFGDSADLSTEAGHVRTLDYLGLDADSPISPPISSSQEMQQNMFAYHHHPLHHPHQVPQSAYPGSTFYQIINGVPLPSPSSSSSAAVHSLSALAASRMRASTVSGLPPCVRRTSPFESPRDGHQDFAGDEDQQQQQDDYSVPLGSANSMTSQYAAAGTAARVGRMIHTADPLLHHEAHDSSNASPLYPSIHSSTAANNNNNMAASSNNNRPRASTLAAASLLGVGPAGLPPGLATTGALNLSSVVSRNRAGTMAGIPKHPGFAHGSMLDNGSGGNSEYVSVVDNNHWMTSSSSSRPMTPDGASGQGVLGQQGGGLAPPPMQQQQPSRSLWVGNLDPSTSAQELMSVFSAYGAIESLRLLPDKECGFVNFVSIHDAIHAKDDVINRLGSQINLKNGQPTQVRIGFGKSESAPQTPGSATTANNGGPNTASTNPPMMILSLNNNLISSTQVLPNPSPTTGFTNFAGILLGPNGDPVLQSSPTRALWIGSTPSQTTPNHLMEIFSPFGPIESARVLTHKNCGFINFEHLDDAVRARKALSGREILGSEVGAVKIGYAKVPVKAPGTFSPSATAASQQQLHESDNNVLTHQIAYETLARMRGASVVPVDQQIMSGSIQDYRSNLAMSFIPNGIHAFNGFSPQSGGLVIPSPSSANMAGKGSSNSLYESSSTGNEVSIEATPKVAANISSAPMPAVTEMQLLMRELSGESQAEVDDENSVSEFRPPVTYYTTVPPPINQLDPHRRLVSATADPPRLREIRKRIDNSTMSVEELDKVAGELLEEIVYLSSDYIGNTIVQKLFEKCSQPVKMQMLERCAPHLAIIGCHKNGTWAAQKMIDCARTPEEMSMISTNLRPFGPPLLLDPLGNYVMQCCLRFGLPYNEFVFDCMIDRCWEVAQGRFGARSMRTCLESKFTTKLQIKKVAIAVILNSIPLATNPNGTLLLTWLLDSSNLPGRYGLLAPRLAPHLSHLCTHKLASVTVLRVMNQSVDPEASKAIVDGLFNSSRSVIEEVLGDQVHGVTVLGKVLGSQFIDAETKSMMAEKLKEVMVLLRLQPIPAYKKLAEELGIPTNVNNNKNTSSTAPTSANPSSAGGGAQARSSTNTTTTTPTSTPSRPSWQAQHQQQLIPAQIWPGAATGAAGQPSQSYYDPRMLHLGNNGNMPAVSPTAFALLQQQQQQLQQHQQLLDEQHAAVIDAGGSNVPYLMLNQLRFHQPSM